MGRGKCREMGRSNSRTTSRRWVAVRNRLLARILAQLPLNSGSSGSSTIKATPAMSNLGAESMPLRGAGVLGVGGTRALRCCNSEPEENILGKGISVLGTIVHSNYGQEGWCTPAAMWYQRLILAYFL
mmetsp:Transcript_14997/g.39698  ORF Transcript_14997/g.39698 Transcript_14997/m.39698 type:complete len:128 (-) Transcript_14997:366-749(-)